jgi:hypothetical protein
MLKAALLRPSRHLLPVGNENLGLKSKYCIQTMGANEYIQNTSITYILEPGTFEADPVHSINVPLFTPNGICRIGMYRVSVEPNFGRGHVSDAPFSIFSSATTTPTSLCPRHIESASKCAPMPTEIQMSLKTGILSNNELSHRMARNNQRQSAAARRAREAHEKAAKAPSGNRGKSRATAVVLSASSSGCVRTTRPRTSTFL